ncbi:MAG: hypothetical protein KF799_10105 [Bdellovibrionales bacterium]|nr:hypothetical protein [Bdellovibrionales bacterium]
MKQFLLRYQKEGLAHFAVYILIFVLTFVWISDWLPSLFIGIVFATVMLLVHGLLRKPKPSPSTDLIVITPPKFFSYILAAGFHFLVLLTIFAYWTRAEERKLAILVCAAYFVLMAAIAYSMTVQVIVGKTLLVVRRRIWGFNKDTTFYLADIFSATVKRFGGLEIRFKDGRKTNIYCYEPHDLSHLPEAKTPSKLKALDPLYRLKDEIEKRTGCLGPGNEEPEELAIRNVAFNTISLKGFVITGLVMMILGMAGTYQNHVQLVEKIKQTSDRQSLRYNDISVGFWLFQGKAFKELEAEWNQNCAMNNDYNCRLASYLASVIGDDARALDLVKKSCSEADPHSCYNVYDNMSALPSDKVMAAATLDRVCQQENFKNQTCCTCYAEVKGQQPANHSLKK